MAAPLGTRKYGENRHATIAALRAALCELVIQEQQCAQQVRTCDDREAKGDEQGHARARAQPQARSLTWTR